VRHALSTLFYPSVSPMWSGSCCWRQAAASKGLWLCCGSSQLSPAM
jgi:hypothetical protein